MSQKPDLADYVDVASRLTQFREAHPNGSLRPLNPDRPYTVETIGDCTFIVVVAAAYRDPGDKAAGVGMAWEPFPGRTPYTRGSELQNAETSAWGRAIVAVLAADTKRGVASAEEVRPRAAERLEYDADDPAAIKRQAAAGKPTQAELVPLFVLLTDKGYTTRDACLGFCSSGVGREITSRKDLTRDEVHLLIKLLEQGAAEDKAP